MSTLGVIRASSVSALLCAVSAFGSPAHPTFADDIAPLLYRNCAGCHHAGEVAPFPLVSYSDAKTHAATIARAVDDRVMPPWQPVPGFAHFQQARRLSSLQIALIDRWVRQGTPSGNLLHAPAAPVFPNGWRLGTPDLVVRAPEPVQVAADGADSYECFVIPMGLSAQRYVRAVEFRPKNRRVVHHALLFTDATHIQRPARYSCFGTVGLLPTEGLGGWSPGNAPIEMLNGAAVPVAAGSRLVAQVHYHPDGKAEEDQWQVGFYFTEHAPVRRVVDVGLASRAIDIAPGDSHYVVRQHFTIPIAIDAVGVIPHAHLICKQMKGWATLPNGQRVWLLRIDDWNFNWQDQYRYSKPIRLPADTRIDMEFVYDNSAANLRNPNSPPERVTWGPGVADEMAGLHIQAIPVNMDELPELGRALWGAVMRSVGGRFYTSPR